LGILRSIVSFSFFGSLLLSPFSKTLFVGLHILNCLWPTSAAREHKFIYYASSLTKIKGPIGSLQGVQPGLGSQEDVDWIPGPSLRYVPHAAQSTSGAGPGETSELSVSPEPPSSRAILRMRRTRGCKWQR
jgi:hypothetical protein